MRRVYRFVFHALCYVLIVGGLIFGLPRFLSWSLATPYPLAAITSGSMWPVLDEGDLVFIRGGLKFEELKVGDVIVWRDQGGPGFTIHRIHHFAGSEIITKGDANFNPDPAITYNQVVGRALSWRGRLVHLPYLGSITVLANNWQS